MIAEKKKEKTRLFHLVKRTEYPAWKGWIIRIIAVVIALFIGSLVCATDRWFAPSCPAEPASVSSRRT